MRIIAILAGKALYTFRNEDDRLLYETSLHHSNWKALPRGSIVGIALVDDACAYDASIHTDPFAFGPYVYHIKDVVPLDIPISYKGNLGLNKLTEEVHAQVMSQQSVQDKIATWIKEEQEVWGQDQLHGISIRQPPAEAIVRGIKKYENRSRSMFSIVQKKVTVKRTKKVIEQPVLA